MIAKQHIIHAHSRVIVKQHIRRAYSPILTGRINSCDIGEGLGTVVQSSNTKLGEKPN